MKKILFVLFAVFVLLSCSKEDNYTYTGDFIDGLYAHYNDKYAVVIGTIGKDGWDFETYCDPGYISVTDLNALGSGYVFVQTKNIISITQESEKGTYFGWEYENGLSLICVPTSEKSFTAKIIKNTSELNLPNEMEFEFHK